MRFTSDVIIYREMKESLENIELVCKLTPGVTIDTTLRTIVDHSRWYSTYVRTYYKENRYKTIIWLEDLFKSVSNLLIHLNYLISQPPIVKVPSEVDGFELLNCIESPFQSDDEDEGTILIRKLEVPPDILNETLGPEERKRLLIDLLIRSIDGLKTLLITYGSDLIIHKRLNQLIATMCVILDLPPENPQEYICPPMSFFLHSSLFNHSMVYLKYTQPFNDGTDFSEKEIRYEDEVD